MRRREVDRRQAIQIRQRDQGVQMLVCSVQSESHFAERALRAGAMGYVNKQEAADKLIEALRQILRGTLRQRTDGQAPVARPSR